MAPITFPFVSRAAPAIDDALFAFRVYNALLLAGFCGILAVLASVLLSPSVRRSGAWINFYLTAMLYAISYLVLFFAGQGVETPPSLNLCLIQAAMTYAVCPLCSCSSFVLSVTMWIGVCKPTKDGRTALRLAGMLLPWILWLTVFMVSLWFGLADRGGVHLTRSLYCMIRNRVPARVSQILVGLTFLANIIFQAMTFRGLWRLDSARDNATTLAGDSPRSFLGIAIRMLLWNIAMIAEVVLIYILLAEPTQDTRVCIVQASLPLLAFAAFGTRRDVFSAWFPCFVRGKDVY